MSVEGPLKRLLGARVYALLAEAWRRMEPPPTLVEDAHTETREDEEEHITPLRRAATVPLNSSASSTSNGSGRPKAVLTKSWVVRTCVEIVGWGVMFYGAGLASSKVLSRVSPGYAALPAKRRDRFDSYVSSMVNALLCSGYSFHKIFCCKRGDPRGDIAILKMMTGYFAQDSYRTRAEWALYPTDFIHHLVAYSVLGAALYLGKFVSPSILPFVSRFLVAEFSTIWLNLMWMTRELNGSALVSRILTVLFVVSFFFVRVVWMTKMIMVLRSSHRAVLVRMGIVRFMLYLGGLLQWYWFAIMLRKFFM